VNKLDIVRGGRIAEYAHLSLAENAHHTSVLTDADAVHYTTSKYGRRPQRSGCIAGSRAELLFLGCDHTRWPTLAGGRLMPERRRKVEQQVRSNSWAGERTKQELTCESGGITWQSSCRLGDDVGKTMQYNMRVCMCVACCVYYVLVCECSSLSLSLDASAPAVTRMFTVGEWHTGKQVGRWVGKAERRDRRVQGSHLDAMR
jgi:hypothetical protein